MYWRDQLTKSCQNSWIDKNDNLLLIKFEVIKLYNHLFYKCLKEAYWCLLANCTSDVFVVARLVMWTYKKRCCTLSKKTKPPVVSGFDSAKGFTWSRWDFLEIELVSFSCAGANIQFIVALAHVQYCICSALLDLREKARVASEQIFRGCLVTKVGEFILHMFSTADALHQRTSWFDEKIKRQKLRSKY